MSGWFGGEELIDEVKDGGADSGSKELPPMEFRYLPNKEEAEVVARLRARLEEERSEYPEGYETFEFTNETIFRFLRSRKHDEEKAFNGLRKHIDWRFENNVHDITPEKIDEEVAKRKIFVKNFDKNGRPLVWVIAARHDSSDRNIEVMKDFIIATIIGALEANKNDRDERFSIVFDLSQFGLACMDYEVVKLLVETLQMNFPDVLEVAYVVDAPFIFNACWAIIKPWLDPVTVNKVNFCTVEELAEDNGIEVVPDYGAEGPLPTAASMSASEDKEDEGY